jgi:tRNA A-37 threonylcarbamoyl transferase component Bud32
MAFVRINPRQQLWLEQQGLTTPEHFLELPAEIICGHPDRNVGRVVLGTGSSQVHAFLKREHRVAWKDRVHNAFAGFGLVPKSCREALTLQAVRRAGIGCPDWIAVGEDRFHRAFLLVQEIAGAKDLRLFLREQKEERSSKRRDLARRIGAILAGLHDAGFDHPDLYYKHVLVDAAGQTISLLDWQRSRRRRFVGRRRRCRDLAALHATLAEDLATPRERLLCLSAYLRRCQFAGRQRHLGQWVSRILGLEKQLLRRRRIREQRQSLLVDSTQSVIRIDGDSLCLTADFHRALNGRVPDFLVLDKLPALSDCLELRTWVSVPEHSRCLLIRRRQKNALGRFWTWVQRRPLSSPELHQAGLLFRLQRCGIRTPRLLAFGQRRAPGSAIESFLLTEPLSNTLPLREWLALSTISGGERHRVIREVGALVRRMHQASCFFSWGRNDVPQDYPGFPLVIQHAADGSPVVAVGHLEGILARRRGARDLVGKDLALLSSGFSNATDKLRFLLSYLNVERVTPAAKHLARRLLRARSSRGRSYLAEVHCHFFTYDLPFAEQGVLP